MNTVLKVLPCLIGLPVGIMLAEHSASLANVLLTCIWFTSGVVLGSVVMWEALTDTDHDGQEATSDE